MLVLVLISGESIGEIDRDDEIEDERMSLPNDDEGDRLLHDKVSEHSSCRK